MDDIMNEPPFEIIGRIIDLLTEIVSRFGRSDASVNKKWICI
jgi:hypothetical protein